MPSVLIVEDDKHHRLLLEEELELEGYRTRTAANGPQALAAFAADRPDLVVVDIAMPGMDGIDLLGRLLAMDNRLPVVIHTGYASYRDSFLAWAADAYVIKHSDLRELKRAIRDVLGQRRPHGQA